MNDLQERLETLAHAGPTRGATAVWHDACASLEAGHVSERSWSRGNKRRQVFVAFALVVAVAVALSTLLIVGGGDDGTRLVKVIPGVPDLRDLFDTSTLPPVSDGRLYLVPSVVPDGMRLIRVSDLQGGPQVRGGTPEFDRAQLWVKFDAAGDRPVASFSVMWGAGATGISSLPGHEGDVHTDPLEGYRSQAVPAEVRGHDGLYAKELNTLAWEEPAGRMASVTGEGVSLEELRGIADALEARGDGSFVVTRAPEGFVEVSEVPGVASGGTNSREIVYQDAAGHGFRITIVDDSENPPGQSLNPSPAFETDARLAEVRGHHAVLARRLLNSGLSFDQQTLFLQDADMHVTWLEPGNVEVTVSAVGLDANEVLAIARGLGVVDAGAWERFLVQAPSRSTGTLPSRNAEPPVFSGEEAEIANAYLSWLNGRANPGDVPGGNIEDGDKLQGTIAALRGSAVSQGSTYSGRVDAVRLVDPDHAFVTFSILNGDKVTLGNQQGGAVRIDGRWKVSRATFCSVIALSGTPCPPG